jgi:hypothetical protein
MVQKSESTNLRVPVSIQLRLANVEVIRDSCIIKVKGNAMKPSFMQLFFAQHWPAKFWLAVVAVVSVFLAGQACEPSLSSLRDWHFLILFAVVLVLAPIFACCTSVILIGIILGPIYRLRGRMNGAPFQVGDKVQILVGPNRGRVVPVDAVWKERGQVCLELGGPREKGVQFAFSYFQVYRALTPKENSSEPAM